MASIENQFKNDEFVLVTHLDDIGQPYSCDQWAAGYEQELFWEDANGQECSQGSEGCTSSTVYPILIDDGDGAELANLFRDGPSAGYPVLAIIDHEMVVQKLFDSCNETQLKYYVQQALDDM